MDLALALVEEDLGREVALETARWLVLFLKRPGGQAQFSAQLAAQIGRPRAAARAPGVDPGPPREDLSVPALAAPRLHERAQLRARLPRRDRHDAGRVRRGGARRERAHRARDRRRCRSSGRPPGGFGTVETMRRAFRRRVGVSPDSYRGRFRSEAAA